MALKAFDLTGQVATITGGNGGIGLGMTDALAQAGAAVCILGHERSEERGSHCKAAHARHRCSRYAAMSATKLKSARIR
jgi:NAD(P)-dependent dehydrogenase (short-subunit alcohol dehydrogenase family)